VADIATLGIAVDSTSAGKAAVELDKLTASATNAAAATETLARSAASAGSAQAQTAASTAASSAGVNTAADKLTASLEKQIALFGASKDAIANYTGAMAGMTEVELDWYKSQTMVLAGMQAQASATAAAAAAQEAATASAARFIASLLTQSETVGMTTSQLLEYKAAQLGVSEQAAPLIASIEAQTAAMVEASAAATVLGESEADAATRVAAMVDASLAQVDAANDSSVAVAKYAESLEAMAATAKSAEGSQAALAESSKAVASAQAAATASVTESSTAMSAAASKVAESLGRQLTALTASKEAMVEYDAQMAGFTASETAQVSAIAAEIAERKEQIAAATEMAAAYGVESTAAVGASIGTARMTQELAVMGREAASGQLTRLAGSFTRLLSLSGALSLLFNPITLGILAIGAAAIKTSEEQQALNEALILTGGIVGTTAGGMQKLAESATASGATIGTATEAVAALASTGKFTAEQIGTIGTATADAATFTSISVKQMVDDFTKLADDPVKASVALNDQYHYLTVAVYDQIAALEKEGDTTGAVQVATDAFADAMEKRTADMHANAGTIEKDWIAIKDAVTNAIEVVGSAVNGPTLEQSVSRQQDQKKQQGDQWTPDEQAGLDKDTQALAAQKADAAAKASAAALATATINAKQRLSILEAEFFTPAQKRAKELADAMNLTDAAGASPEEQIDLQANINNKYKDKKTPGTGSVDTTQMDSAVKSVEDASKLELDAISTTQKSIDDEYKDGIISASSYYQQQRDLLAQAETDQINAANSEIAILQKALQSKSLNADQRAKINAQIIADQDKVAAATQGFFDGVTLSAQKSDDATTKSANALLAYQAVLNAKSTENQKSLNQQTAPGGQDPDQQKLQKQIQDAQDNYTKAVGGLQADQLKDPNSSTDYTAMIAAQKNLYDTLVQQDTDAYNKMKANEGSWENGVEASWQKFQTQADNTSGQVAGAFSNLFDGLTDAVVKFAETGKINFLNLAISFSEALLKMEVQAAESQVFKLIQQGFISAFGGGVSGTTGSTFGGSTAGEASSGVSTGFSGSAMGYATGGHITGAGSSTSDSIPAMLSNGEFVVNAASTAANRPLLEALNGSNGSQSSAGRSHFATGGFVSSPTVSGGGTALTFNIDNSNTSSLGTGTQGSQTQSVRNDAMQKELESSVIEIVRKHAQPGGQVNKIIKSVNQ